LSDFGPALTPSGTSSKRAVSPGPDRHRESDVCAAAASEERKRAVLLVLKVESNCRRARTRIVRGPRTRGSSAGAQEQGAAPKK
jgi:hypothetical protein